ncbi:hypothetical protein TruAng_007739 [Truncatella angustata]|nr:hypothetical protein TruAng_007739 [Truncatella angustata]
MSDSEAISADSLGPEHYDALSKAIHQVLATDLAFETYAQIIDGLPLCDVAWNRYQHRLCQEHPINSHKSLCPGSIEKASSFQDAFTVYEQYPNGVADMVGYWAEDRILGGVLLFDRTKDGGNGGVSGYEPNVYLQSSRPKRTYLIYQLTDAQQQSLLDFLLLPTPPVPLSERSNPKTPAPSCPLPLSFSSENQVSIDPEFAVVKNNIYRDVWERPPPRPYQGLIRDRDVVDTPGVGDAELAKLRKLGL